MGRRKTLAQLERQVQYAKNRAAYKPPAREQGTPTRRTPRIAVGYKPMQIAAGDTAQTYLVQASKEAVAFFGGTKALSLVDGLGQEGLPRGARPAKVTAMVADTSPQLVKAVASKRPYIHYGKGTRDSKAQYTYSAPISIQNPSKIDDQVKTLFTAIRSKLGGPYGRVYFNPERFVLSGSGQ